jgi:hypothetical protein
MQIEKDFDMIYSGKSNQLFSAWPQMAGRVLDLVRTAVKDKCVQQILVTADGDADKGVLTRMRLQSYSYMTSKILCCCNSGVSWYHSLRMLAGLT